MDKNEHAVSLGKLGGKKKAERMTEEERKEHSRKMNEARKKKLPTEVRLAIFSLLLIVRSILLALPKFLKDSSYFFWKKGETSLP